MSTKKRQTKQQREAAEIAAIRARLCDIVQGTWGGYGTEEIRIDEGSIQGYTSAEAFARFVAACEYIWGNKQERPYLFSLNSLGHFDTVDSAAKYLHGHGCRA